MGGSPSKEELQNQIKMLQKQISNSEERARAEQEKLINTINQLLKQKSIQEHKEYQNEENSQRQLMEQFNKMNNKIIKDYNKRMRIQEEHYAKLLEEEKQKRIEREKQQRKNEEEFRSKILKEQQEQQKSYQKMLSKIQEDADKASEEAKRKFNEEIAKKEKEFKNLEQKIKNERDKAKKEALEKEKKALEMQRKKEENAEKDFNTQSQNLITKLIKKSEIEFQEQENNFCKNEISQFDKKKVVELIKKLNKSEQLDLKLENVLKNYSQNYSNQNNNKEVNHLNIVLVGPSGVGKSTLINSILKLSKEKELKTQTTDPCTMGEPKYYESENMPSLRLADSRGIEKGNYGVEQVVTSTENFVNNQIDTKDPDKYVHCIWYCITDSRFEDIEVQSLERLAALYDNSKLPIIVVYTRAVHQEFVDGIRKKVENLGHNLGYVAVIAKEIEIKAEDEDDEPQVLKPKGLEKLKRISIDKAKDAISSSCYSALKKNITKIVKFNLEQQSARLNDYLKIKINEKIENLKEGTDITLLENSIIEIIVEIIKIYLSDQNENDPISPDGYNHIKNFLNNFFQESMNYYSNCLLKLISGKSENYSQEVVNLQLELIQKHNGNLKKYKNKNEFEAELKNEIVKTLKSKAELYCMKNAARFITQPVKEYFEKFIRDKYIKFIDSENIQIVFQEEAAKTFDKLGDLILGKKSKVTPK